MIDGDAYGLWTFPGADGAVRERVPVTVASDEAAIDGLRDATEQALAELTVAGPTPLLAAVEADCTDSLERVTEASGGECLRSYFGDLDDDLRSIARVI